MQGSGKVRDGDQSPFDGDSRSGAVGGVEDVRRIEGLVPVDWPSEYLGVSEARIYSACRAGLLPHVRFGRRIFFPPKQLIAWAEGGGKSYPGGWRKEPVE